MFFKFPVRMAWPFPRPSARAPHYYMCYRLHLARCNRPVVCSSKFMGKGDAICSASCTTSHISEYSAYVQDKVHFTSESIHGARDFSCSGHFENIFANCLLKKWVFLFLQEFGNNIRHILINILYFLGQNSLY